MFFQRDNISSLLKNMVITVVFLAALLQPITQTLAIFCEEHLELIEVDQAEDSDNPEEKEESAKDKKLKYHHAQFYANAATVVDTSSNYPTSVSYEGILIEIPIPPPDSTVL
ncbi:hypothetical protein ABN763_01840 [Spongiivirga sp. MCCC 1A20706]